MSSVFVMGFEHPQFFFTSSKPIHKRRAKFKNFERDNHHHQKDSQLDSYHPLLPLASLPSTRYQIETVEGFLRKPTIIFSESSSAVGIIFCGPYNLANIVLSIHYHCKHHAEILFHSSFIQRVFYYVFEYQRSPQLGFSIGDPK